MRTSVNHQTVDEFAEDEGISAVGVYDALADERRRTTLSALAEATLPVDVDALARAVANREVDPTRKSVPEERVDTVRVALRRTHLPQLDEAGLLAYDGDSTVEDAVDDLESLLA